MTKEKSAEERNQTLGEEIANSISHGVALLATLVALPVLVVAAVRQGDVSSIVGASVFGTSMIMLYLASTVYHLLPQNRAKQIFRIIDHSAIYLLIAGTYTPFTLGVLRGGWGWTLFGLVWALAVVGIVFKIFGGIRFKKLSLGLYIVMGWLVVIAIKPLVESLPGWGMFWLAAGGAAYTLGSVAYVLDHRRYVHFVWHLFVVAGTTCHFIAVLNYACC